MKHTVSSLASTMHHLDLTRCADLLQGWAEKLPPQVADERLTTFEEMATALQDMAHTGLIRQHWRMEWDHTRKEWRTRFTVRGGQERVLCLTQFRAYRDGWTDRRTALIHRYR